MLQRDEWLAPLQTHFDDASGVLTIRRNGAVAAQGDLETAEGRAAIEGFFRIGGCSDQGTAEGSFEQGSQLFGRRQEGRIHHQSRQRCRDREHGRARPFTLLRFRANLYVSGWPAWHEFELLDRTLAIGETRLKVVKRITRCAAVNVDPETAVRDLDIPTALMRRLGHTECGIYAEVIAGGAISVGDAISMEEPKPE